MGVASSRFHLPYVHFTYIDIHGALRLAHNITLCGGKCAGCALAHICDAHLIARMNARLLFEGGYYFFEHAKRAATIRGGLLFGVRLLFK